MLNCLNQFERVRCITLVMLQVDYLIVPFCYSEAIDQTKTYKTKFEKKTSHLFCEYLRDRSIGPGH